MNAGRFARAAFLLCILALSCARAKPGLPASPEPSTETLASPAPAGWPRLDNALAVLPPEMAARILAEREAFLSGLAAIPEEGWEYLIRVDKSQALPPAYLPADLISLNGTGLSLSRKDLSLRSAALEALLDMDRAAREEGIILLASSCFRSYEYQKGVWDRSIAAYGHEQTQREVAMPGHSQHQLGTAIDFGSIDDSFTLTTASHWLENNANTYGFSLSYPKDGEAITGYRFESWHYRYIGREAAALQDRWFGGIQHWLLLFLDSWSKATP